MKGKFFILLSYCYVFLGLSIWADSFLDEENNSYEKSREDPNLLVFVTSHVIPLEPSFIQNTPYGRMISIPQEALNPQNNTQITSKGVYNRGNYTIFRSDKNAITFYRHSRNKTNQYARMAPNIYPVTHFAGTFYKIEPMPPSLNQCSLIISRTFEAHKTSNMQLMIDLDSVPNRGIANIMLECPKPDEY